MCDIVCACVVMLGPRPRSSLLDVWCGINGAMLCDCVVQVCSELRYDMMCGEIV